MIEVTGLGGPRLPLVLLPGLLAAGDGPLLALGPLQVPHFGQGGWPGAAMPPATRPIAGVSWLGAYS